MCNGSFTEKLDQGFTISDRVNNWPHAATILALNGHGGMSSM